MNVVNTRIAQRFDTLAGWQQQDPILLDGELAVISTDNQIRFKVGDGQHKFTELQYIDYFKITTLSAFANVLSGNSLAVGFQNEAAAHSIAVGSNVSAKAQHSIALGNHAATSSLDSFVFNGDNGYNVDAYYDHGIGTFNVNAPLSNIYIQQSAFSDILSEKAESSALNKKITILDAISNLCAQTDLSIVKLSADDYAELVATSSTISNCLYIVEDDIINACGQQISNLAPGIGLSDAVNLEQLSNAISSIQIPTDLSAFTNSPGYLSSIETVAPTSSDSGKGKAADAKAVGDVLYTGFTEWEFTGNGLTDEVKEKLTLSYDLTDDEWELYFNNSWIKPEDSAGGNPNSLTATFSNVMIDGNTYPLITATRHLVIPKKTSQLTNDAGFLTAVTAHAHGNITNVGSITGNSADLANGDSLVFVDSSNNSKIKKTSITFDGSTTNSFLSKKGTFQTALTTIPNTYKTYSATVESLSDSGYALKTDIQMSYHQNEHKIVLSAGSNETSVDCSDFIKDGMLSTAELCGTQLVLTFNTDAGSQPISVELSNFIDDYDSSIQSISDAVDAKITIDDQISGLCAQTNLSIVKLSADDYAYLVATSATVSNCLYIVEDEFINACGQQIKNLSAPTEISDAATKGYVDSAVQGVQIPTDLSSFTNSPGYLVSDDISDCYKKTETSSSSELSDAFAEKRDYADRSFIRSVVPTSCSWILSIPNDNDVELLPLINGRAWQSGESEGDYFINGPGYPAYWALQKMVSGTPTTIGECIVYEEPNVVDFGNGYVARKNQPEQSVEDQFALEGEISSNYLSSNALDNYKSYNATLSSLSADGYATQAWVNQQLSDIETILNSL